MAESKTHKQLMFEIMNRKNYDSESSAQQFEEDEEPASPKKDPGVLNTPVTEEAPAPERQRRALSQPGPVSGSLLTATAARAARRRPQKNVMYAEPERLDVADKQSPKFLTTFRLDDADSVSVGAGDRASPLPYNGNYRNNGDSRSLNSYRQYASNNDMRGVGTPRKRSVVTMDAQSIRSVETHAPPPTSPEKNKELTLENITISLSCMYAILIITVGVVIYFADLFIEGINISPIYSIILSVTGFIYMLFLLLDISRYKSIVMANQKIRSLHEENLESFFRKQEIEYGQMTPGDRTPDTLRSNTFPGPQLIPQRHDYCFSQGRHSGSFYLKLGAAAFALGHLVHSVLLIVVQIALVTDENIDNDDCVDNFQVVFDFINPLFCFFQLFFIFKYSNVIILRREGLARFAFMHFIGTSLCFWVSAIIRETVLGLTLYAQSVYGNGYEETNQQTNRAVSRAQDRFFDVSGLYDENCVGSDAISTIYANFSPYLYPFSVEFNILVVAVYYIIWSNIGNYENDKCKEDDDDVDSSLFDTHTVCNRIPTASEHNDFSSNIVIYADCHASNRGLFVGMTLLVLVVGMLILGFVFSSVGEEFLGVGYLVSDCTKLFIHTCLLLSAVIAFNQTKKMDINEHPVSLLDDILLFICLPAFFMESVLSMVATVSILNIVKTIDFVVMVIQVVIQTALIVDGLRRCSNTKKLRRSKPGREVIMFLIIANVAMWLFNTFSFKSPESLDERYAFYGKVVWSILGHISLPLIMFYRFHSSVCFADIWDSAYNPGSEH